jgi:hypothetical protein
MSAAHSLVEVLKIYRKQHSLRQTNVQIVHLVFTASIVHVYNACTTYSLETPEAMEDLQICCQALGELGQTWRNATRALEVIICLKREWQSKAAAFVAARTKRSSESVVDGTDADVHRRIRQRTLDSVAGAVPTIYSFNTLRVTQASPVVTEETSTSSEMPDAWDFLNGTDLNFGLGNEVFLGIDDDPFLFMDSLDSTNDAFAFGALINPTGDL